MFGRWNKKKSVEHTFVEHTLEVLSNRIESVKNAIVKTTDNHDDEGDLSLFSNEHDLRVTVSQFVTYKEESENLIEQECRSHLRVKLKQALLILEKNKTDLDTQLEAFKSVDLTETQIEWLSRVIPEKHPADLLSLNQQQRLIQAGYVITTLDRKRRKEFKNSLDYLQKSMMQSNLATYFDVMMYLSEHD